MKNMFLLFFTLFGTSLSAISLNLGPFSLKVPAEVRVGTPHFAFYNDPICYAIENRKLLLLVIENEDNSIDKLFIEPYEFGYNQTGNLILQGFEIEEQELHHDKEEKNSNNGIFGGVFSTYDEKKGWADLSVHRILEIRILEDTYFDIRLEGIQNLREENKIVDPICVVDAR